MKTMAFYKDDDGEWQRIRVEAALSLEKKEPGRWRKRPYFSTHFPPEVRIPMHIVKRKGYDPYFAYNPKDKEAANRLGAGESLEHYLYKTAISELKSTTLKFNIETKDGKLKKKEINVQFTHTETEKKVTVDGRDYYIDVFVNFTSDSIYELKWGGQLGIEVHKTNEVQGPKLAGLISNRIPIIEVDVNEKLTQHMSEEGLTPEKERKHIEFLKKCFEDYIWSKVLSNPVTLEFLEQGNKALKDRLTQVENQLNTEREAHQETRRDLDRSTQNLAQRNQLITSLNSELKKYKDMSVWKFWQQKKKNKKN